MLFNLSVPVSSEIIITVPCRVIVRINLVHCCEILKSAWLIVSAQEVLVFVIIAKEPYLPLGTPIGFLWPVSQTLYFHSVFLFKYWRAFVLFY